MTEIIVEPNQTIFDLAVKHYGNVEAVGEILELNTAARTDAEGYFWFDHAILPGDRILIDEKSPLMRKNTVKELLNEPVTTWQGQ
jgi:hypothetical protein